MEDMKMTVFKSKKMSVNDFRELLGDKVNKSICAFLEQCDDDIELEIRFVGWQIDGDIVEVKNPQVD